MLNGRIPSSNTSTHSSSFYGRVRSSQSVYKFAGQCTHRISFIRLQLCSLDYCKCFSLSLAIRECKRVAYCSTRSAWFLRKTSLFHLLGSSHSHRRGSLLFLQMCSICRCGPSQRRCCSIGTGYRYTQFCSNFQGRVLRTSRKC